MEKINICSKEIIIVDIESIKLNPKNRNKHTDLQIGRLAEIIKYQGYREPGTISNRSGYLVSGECRYHAAKLLGMKKIPVIYQDFESEDQETAYGISTNAIKDWATLDLSGINTDMVEMGPDFNVDLLGLRDFLIEPADKFNPEDEWKEMPEFNQEDKKAYRTILVHFANDGGVDSFSKLVKQNITDKTKYIWHPQIKKMDNESKRY